MVRGSFPCEFEAFSSVPIRMEKRILDETMMPTTISTWRRAGIRR